MDNNNLLAAIQQLLDDRLGKVHSDYMDTASACQFLNISKSTLYKLNHRNVIPFYKPVGSKKVYYNKKNLIEYITKSHTLSREEIDRKVQDFIINKRNK